MAVGRYKKLRNASLTDRERLALCGEIAKHMLERSTSTPNADAWVAIDVLASETDTFLNKNKHIVGNVLGEYWKANR